MVKEDRKLIVYILLTIITFGIYGIYTFIWMYRLGNRLAANAPR